MLLKLIIQETSLSGLFRFNKLGINNIAKKDEKQRKDSNESEELENEGLRKESWPKLMKQGH